MTLVSDVGGWVGESSLELSAEITFPIVKGLMIPKDNLFCKMSSVTNLLMGSSASNLEMCCLFIS